MKRVLLFSLAIILIALAATMSMFKQMLPASQKQEVAITEKYENLEKIQNVVVDKRTQIGLVSVILAVVVIGIALHMGFKKR
jgi:peptidoglycan hydrolase CwlO-like protein